VLKVEKERKCFKSWKSVLKFEKLSPLYIICNRHFKICDGKISKICEGGESVLVALRDCFDSIQKHIKICKK